MKEPSYNIVKFSQPDYPPLLRRIANPPKQLWYAGDLSLASRTCVAVVGSRQATPYGRWVAGMLGSKLARYGMPLVSGMALGIDGAGHRSALEHGGTTIAVLGTGIKRCYPSSHHRLMGEIRERGLILTEYPPEFRATPYSFPARNRIISGLSVATVVVEAGISSGALITAGFSEEQGRRTYAIPGNINSLLSAGTNRLLADGAMPLLAFEDLLEDLGIPRLPEEEVLQTLQADEIQVYQALAEQGEMTTDQLCRRLGCSVARIQGLVTVMEMKGVLWTAMGKIFIAK